MSRTLSLPTTLDSGNFSDSDADLNSSKNGTPSKKYSHVRAQLAAIARQGKLDAYDGDEGDTIIEPALVTKVVALLSEEREDDLKELLCAEFGLDEESVSCFLIQNISY